MPGTLIREKAQRIPRSLPTDTGMMFIAGVAERGPTDKPVLVRNMTDFADYVGARTSYSLVYDMVDAYFQEGGKNLWFSRVFGPTPTYATVTLKDGSAVNCLVITAAYPGDWGSLLNVQVIAGDVGGQFKLVITHDTDATINETSPSFPDQATAIQFYSTHKLIRAAASTSALNPAVAAVASLVGGTDDRANATDATWQAALDRFAKDLGPGQVLYAGRTTSVAWQQLLTHADLNNRVALCDNADVTAVTESSAVATWAAQGAAFKLLTNSENGALFGPWVNLPALPGTPSAQLRAIPPSAVAAGLMARNDASGNTPDDPAAGDNGILDFVDSLRMTLSDANANTVNGQNFNLFRSKAGELKLYGYRTGADPIGKPLYWMLNNARLYMAIAAKADNILEQYVLRKIDGRGKIFKELEGKLTDMLMDHWEDGDLFGDTSQEAFFVDTDSVNTRSPNGGTIGAGEIHAAIEITMSPEGETVILDITRRAVS
jgi:hypothetical protein